MGKPSEMAKLCPAASSFAISSSTTAIRLPNAGRKSGLFESPAPCPEIEEVKRAEKSPDNNQDGVNTDQVNGMPCKEQTPLQVIRESKGTQGFGKAPTTKEQKQSAEAEYNPYHHARPTGTGAVVALSPCAPKMLGVVLVLSQLRASLFWLHPSLALLWHNQGHTASNMRTG